MALDMDKGAESSQRPIAQIRKLRLEFAKGLAKGHGFVNGRPSIISLLRYMVGSQSLKGPRENSRLRKVLEKGKMSSKELLEEVLRGREDMGNNGIQGSMMGKGAL